MSLLSPWALWWLLSLPLLITFYLFRPEPRRKLSSTFFLWKQSVPESQGGVYAKRLRSNPLLWLQLLVLILLALYLARPATSWSALVPTSRKVVMIVDRSASMQANGAFQEALTKASTALDGIYGLTGLGSKPEVMLLAVDREPQILVPFTSDSAQLRTALRDLKATEIGDRLETLRPFLASLIKDQKATIWLFGDHLPSELEIPGLQFSACGEPNHNNAGFVAFSVELSRESGSPKPFVYARLQNFSASAEQRILVVEKMNLQHPDQVEATVLQSTLLLPAAGGRTWSETIPSSRLSATEASLFRARLLPVPGAPATSLDTFSVDDSAFTIAPPFGQDRITVSIMPDLKASFLLRALIATGQVEVLDWDALLAANSPFTLDLAVCRYGAAIPSKLTVRSKFLVQEQEPEPKTPVESLRANPDQPLVQGVGVEWSRLRVQRDKDWPAVKDETTLLSTAGGPALTLSGLAQGQPTLNWRFPLAYSSLPLSPALPVLVSRFIDQYSSRATRAIHGSLSSNERRGRPAGAAWAGAVQIQAASGAALKGFPGGVMQTQDEQFPRLGYSGFYWVRNPDLETPALVAVNLFSDTESRLPHSDSDLSFVESGDGPAAQGEAANPRLQYRESGQPLAALAVLLLFLEAALFLRRGRP